MKKKYQLSVAVLTALLVMALCACGGDKPATVSSAVQSNPSSADTTMQVSSEPEAEVSSTVESQASSLASSKAASSKKSPSKTTSSKKSVSSTPSRASSPATTKSGMEIYQAANQNYKKWINKEMVIKISDETESSSAMKLTQRQAQKGEALHYSMDFEMTLNGEKYTVSLYSIGDVFAACTDGVWEKISEEEANDIILSLGFESGDGNSEGNILEDFIVNNNTITKQSVTMSGNKYLVHLALDPQKAGMDSEDIDAENAKITALHFDLVISKDFQIESMVMTQQATSSMDGISVAITVETQVSYRQISTEEMTAPDVLTQQTI